MLQERTELVMSTPSDSCPRELPAESLTGTEAACGGATAANGVQTSRCEEVLFLNSGHLDGRLKPLSVAGDGYIPAAQQGETAGGGSAASSKPGEVSAQGYEQEGIISCRKDKAAKCTGTQQPKWQPGHALGGPDAAQSIGTSPAAESPGPARHAKRSARNEETLLVPSTHCAAAHGASDPTVGREGAGSPTKPMPRCNGGDMPNSDISSRTGPALLPVSKPSKQDVQAASWQVVDWPSVEAGVFRIQRAIHAAIIQGNNNKAFRLQMKLMNSLKARLIAVRKAAEDSKGRATAGVDGLASLNDAQKWRLAETIRFDMAPQPLRRVLIPKADKNETRPLSIPTIRDRAIQHLIKLAVEPAAEACLAPEQFGFRPGRSCHDAAQHICLRLRKPSYVLDADLSKFFDRIPHDAILRVIPGPPRLIKAIRRLLKAGISDGVELTQPDSGTPQGGPLSPLLANLVLADLAASITRVFPATRMINGKKIAKAPYTPSYADDFLSIHERLDVIQEVRGYIETKLAGMGLELNSDKTAIRHTSTKKEDLRGFDFLGFNFRHHEVGRHQAKGARWFLWRGPSKKSLQKVYEKCAAIIDGSKRSRKRNGAIKDAARKGKATPEEVMITRLNSATGGWCNYHRPFFAKQAFSDLDHLLFQKLWSTALRKHPRRNRAWIVKYVFNNASPWRYGTTLRSGKLLQVSPAAATPIVRHYPVKAEESWFDGNWAYWAKRAGHYPMITKSAGGALKRQRGKCPHCKESFTEDASVVMASIEAPKGFRNCVIHRQCADALRCTQTESVFVSCIADRSPVRGNSYAGFEEEPNPRGLGDSTND